MHFDPVALIGFMGAGKTTVGRAAAHALSTSFSDLDDRTEEIAGMRLPEISEHLGEIGLRRLESVALSNLAAFGGVVATSSASIMFPKNRALLENHFTVFFLDADFTILDRRIAGTGRPVLRSMTNKELEKLFFLRYPLYKETADIILDATKPVETLVSEILERVIR